MRVKNAYGFSHIVDQSSEHPGQVLFVLSQENGSVSDETAIVASVVYGESETPSLFASVELQKTAPTLFPDSYGNNTLTVRGHPTTSTLGRVGFSLLLQQTLVDWEPDQMPTPPLVLGYVTPEDFGAVGDGIADDSAAVQAALDDTKPCVLLADYRIVTPLTLSLAGKGVTALGGKLITDQQITVLTVTARCRVTGLRIDGSGRDDTGPHTQHGLFLNGCRGALFENFASEDMGGDAVAIENTNPLSGGVAGVTFVAPRIYRAWCGFNPRNLGEYVTISAIDTSQCRTGILIQAGNLNVSGGKIMYSTYSGVHLQAGANGGHGLMVGVQVNHSNFTAFFIEGPQPDGFRFIDGYCYDGMIYVGGDAQGIRFEGQHFDFCTFNMGGMASTARLILSDVEWGVQASGIVSPAPSPTNVVLTGGTNFLSGAPSNGPFPPLPASRVV